MLKTLPVFVLEYGQAVYVKEEYRQCLNILKLKIKNIIANNEEKVKAEYTYGATGGVTYGNGTSTSYMYNKGNMIEKVTNNNADNTCHTTVMSIILMEMLVNKTEMV